jgi:hypothetical protein
MNVSGVKVEDLQEQYNVLMIQLDEEFEEILSP